MLYKISNNIYDIKDLLIKLQDTYGEYAFISYIDGEYGIRVWVYNSICYNFYNKCKEQETTVIGICFLNTKSFLNNCCDHIIEIQDIAFNTTREEIIDNSQCSQSLLKNGLVTSNCYEGNDGWNPQYYIGSDYIEYENMLDMMEFKNIFYTLHCPGASYINKINTCSSDGNIIIAKINNKNITINNIANYIRNTFNIVTIDTNGNKKIYNAICIWIRNTTKWPHRNMSPDAYNSIFNYCISNKIKCYVFQDLIPIDLPINDYIIDSTDRYRNRPNFDKYLDICNKCDYYIGCDSGSTEFINAYSSTPIRYTSHVTDYILSNNNSRLLNLNDLY